MSDADPFTKPRTDDGSRKIYSRIESFEKTANERLSAIEDDILATKKKVEEIWKWISASVLSVAVVASCGAVKFNADAQDKIDKAASVSGARMDRLDAKLDGLVRYLLENQSRETVRRDVAERLQEIGPPEVSQRHR